jgi:hypothetical protein
MAKLIETENDIEVDIYTNMKAILNKQTNEIVSRRLDQTMVDYILVEKKLDKEKFLVIEDPAVKDTYVKNQKVYLKNK